MSAGSGEGGFSTAGTAPSSSSASEPAPPQPLGFDPEGAVFGPVPIPGAAHIVSGVIEAGHLIETGGTGIGPILVDPHMLESEPVPEAELDTDMDDDGIEG